MLLYNKALLAISIILVWSLANSTNQHHRRKKSKNDTLFLVHVIFRHGERTPQRSYPKDIYRNSTYYPFGFGELTNKGKMRMYDLGLSLRKRYDKFLGTIYNHSTVVAASSAYPRTRMSCELVTAGMFRPSSVQKWNPELNWQPSLCDYVALEDDYMFLSESNCKVLPLKRVEVERDRIMGKFNRYKALFQYLNESSGLKMETPADVTPLYDILRCQNEMEMHLPDWTQKVFPYPMTNLSILDWDYNVKTDELKRFGGGVLLKTIVDSTKKKIQDDPDFNNKKMYIFSGHDSNIVPLLSILGIYEREIMSYATTILIEVHKINGKYIFKVYFQNTEKWYPRYKPLPDCQKNCTLYKFVTSYQKYFGTKEMCTNP